MKLPVSEPRREALNTRRRSLRWEVSIGEDAETYMLTVGVYADGRVGEVFLDGDKGALDEVRSALNLLAISVSIGLQYGVPLEEYVEAFIHTRFGADGIVFGSDRVKFTSSPADWAFREIAIEFLGRDDLASTPPPREEDDGN